jgi:hypothetical protein
MELLIQAVLNRIEQEMDRLYYNANQKELVSPFQNTGAEYSNDTFTVRAYYWGEDDDLIKLPNFKYKDFECSWYKHSMRGLTWKYNGVLNCKDIPLQFFIQMLNDCFDSMWEDFKKK